MTNQKIKGFLFDFNGTLYFDSFMHIKAFQIYSEKYGIYNITPEYAVKNIFGRDNYTVFEQTFNRKPTEEEVHKFTKEKEGIYQKLCLEHPSGMHFTEGAEELLNFLKDNGIPYCLATGSDIFNVKFYTKEMKLDRWFTKKNLVYADGSFPGKPCPDIYLIAAEKLGLSPSECVVFEDGPSGMMAANKAGAGGLVCIYEKGLPYPVENGIRCDAVYNDFTQWKEILKNLGF